MRAPGIAILLALSIAAASAGTFEEAAETYRQRNYEAAFEQFEALAAEGDSRAQTVVAMMYKFGESVDEDPAKAFEWYLRAANNGYAPAQFNVGEMYREGLGIEADRVLAITWLTRAAEGGYELANDSLAKLNAEPVALDERGEGGVVEWSREWNFRLPNNVRFQPAGDRATVGAAGWRVQLGAMGTQAAANRLWSSLAGAFPELFADIDPLILRGEATAHRVYRVQAEPFPDLAGARAFCDALAARQVQTGCLPLPIE